MAIIQGGVYRKLRFSLHTLIKSNLALLAVGFFFFAFAKKYDHFSISNLFVIAFAISILNPSISAQTSLLSDERTQGSHLGILQSLNSLARAVIPLTANLFFMGI